MNGTDVMKRADAAFEIQQNHTSIWREAASFCLARKIWTPGEGGQMEPFTPDPNLQNTTALRALNDMASGMQSAFISAGESWWTWEPADELPVKTDALYDWYLNATQIALRQLGPSGFYSRAGEMIKDAGCMGTSVMMIEGPKTGSGSALNCSTWDIGSYAIRENCAGVVDACWRRIPYTISQAEQEWPDYKPKAWARLTMDQKMKMEEDFTLEIMPREMTERGGKGQMNMPVSACIVHCKTKEIVWMGGFEEMPAIAYRFERQSGVNPWGVGPGINSLADARGVNWLDAQIADGVGKMVEPPIVAKDDSRGTIDLRMGGISMVSDMNQVPRPLYEVGNMQTGEAFLAKKQQQLRGHFFADLFAFFMDDRSYKTATEVMEIKAEKLDLFGPFGHRFLVEFVDPALERIFMVLLRQGMFGDPPREAFARTATGGWKFLYPKSVQQSRMSLLLHQQGNREIRQLLTDVFPIAQIDPTALDHLNMNAIVRHLARGSVAMRGITRTPEEAAMIGQARAQAAQQQQEMDMMAKFATKNPDHAAAAIGMS